MDIVTLKITIVNNYLSLKINDVEQEKYKINMYKNIHLDEIFDTPVLSRLWTKMCMTPCYIYFLYNVSNLNLRLKMCNIFNSNINNKTLLANLFFNKDDTTLTIDFLDTKLDTEINILIKIIVPSIRYSYLKTHNVWHTLTLKDGSKDGSKDSSIAILNYHITVMIKLSKPNPMFRLCRIDTIEDYDKKIKSFKMPLYDEKCQTNYNVIFDLYPTQSTHYILILSEIVNFHTTNSYKFKFDKECMKCINRIKGCELNMISKVQLCCECNIELIIKDIDKFINQHYMCLSIRTTDFPSYIKENFSTYPTITI